MSGMSYSDLRLVSYISSRHYPILYVLRHSKTWGRSVFGTRSSHFRSRATFAFAWLKNIIIEKLPYIDGKVHMWRTTFACVLINHVVALAGYGVSSTRFPAMSTTLLLTASKVAPTVYETWARGPTSAFVSKHKGKGRFRYDAARAAQCFKTSEAAILWANNVFRQFQTLFPATCV